MAPPPTDASTATADVLPGREISGTAGRRSVPVPRAFWRKVLAFSGPGYLVLLRHKRRRFCRPFLRAQQAHRGARRVSATIRRRRKVAIEFGT